MAGTRIARISMTRRQEPSGLKKLLSVVVPAAAVKKVADSPKRIKAGGLALVATVAAAGVAFKNRGKLSELRGKGSDAGLAGTDDTATPPGTPVA